MPGWPSALRSGSPEASAPGLPPGPGPQSGFLTKGSRSAFLQPSIPQVPNYRLSMTIPDWLQAIQNYMKTLQYPSNQGLSRPSQGDGRGGRKPGGMSAPADQQTLSKVGEAGHAGVMPLRQSLEGVIIQDVNDQTLFPWRRTGAQQEGTESGVGHLESLCLPSPPLSPPPPPQSSFLPSLFLHCLSLCLLTPSLCSFFFLSHFLPSSERSSSRRGSPSSVFGFPVTQPNGLAPSCMNAWGSGVRALSPHLSLKQS